MPNKRYATESLLAPQKISLWYSALMPSTWGSSPEEDNPYAGNDIPQYTKFFDLHDMDFEMRRVSGLWDVCAWTRSNEDVWAVSKKFESLGEAFNSCYAEVKNQMRLLSPGVE